jgi:hypothetical protein
MSREKSQSNVEFVEPAIPGRAGRGQTLVTWVLALLTVPAAIVAVFVGIGGVISIAGCSGQACSGPGSVLFPVLLYGAPVVAAVAVIASFFTAPRRWGIAVPLCALALLAADLVVLTVSF